MLLEFIRRGVAAYSLAAVANAAAAFAAAGMAADDESRDGSESESITKTQEGGCLCSREVLSAAVAAVAV